MYIYNTEHVLMHGNQTNSAHIVTQLEFLLTFIQCCLIT